MVAAGVRACARALVALSLWPAASAAASPHVLRARDSSAQVTYKQTDICETTSGVKAYSGYVTLNSSVDATQPYTYNAFFWFFESRNDPKTDPLTLWFQPGPGSGATHQAVGGHNGPCTVQKDSNSTELNPWSWNKYSNVLYIDQFDAAGYSYDSINDGVLNVSSGAITTDGSVKAGGYEYRAGKWPSQNANHTANSTAIAALAVKHFVNLWFDEFPQYKVDKVNLWGESIGGMWVPSIATALLNSSTVGVDTVGLISPLIDLSVLLPSYPEFARNNTYGIEVYNSSVQAAALDAWSKTGGCKDKLTACRELQDAYDADGFNANASVVATCKTSFLWCWGNVFQPYVSVGGRDGFDITQKEPNSVVAPYMYGYLNNEWVQSALGARVNYTTNSGPLGGWIQGTGAMTRRDPSRQLGGLLTRGVRVALLHGDRDVHANWVGGEQQALNLQWGDKDKFADAGYAPLQTNSSYQGGFVRQHGNLSFARVFQAGHDIPIYQGETAQEVFRRMLEGLDVATGKVKVDGESYSSSGAASVFNVTTKAPGQTGPLCYVDFTTGYCTPDQLTALFNGSATVVDRVVKCPGPSCSSSSSSGAGGGSSDGGAGGSSSGAGRAVQASGSLALAGALLVLSRLAW